jgi:hypothetical protein
MAGTPSGGEQQMVAIGRGMMARPRLLLDELSLGWLPNCQGNLPGLESLREMGDDPGREQNALQRQRRRPGLCDGNCTSSSPARLRNS